MNYLTVKDLRGALAGVPDDVVVHLCEYEREYVPFMGAEFDRPVSDDERGVFIIKLEGSL